MRKLASIQRIKNIEPIEGADNIEVVTIKGWQCVARKGEFEVGDYCVYFEPDSLIPRREWSEFLFKDKSKEVFRLRTVRLRGCISQGLAIPVKTLFPNAKEILEEEFDMSDLLRITKYEAPIPAQLQGTMKGSRPSFVPKTDEERIQNVLGVVDKYAGEVCYITEKLDGSSMSVYANNGEVGVCSRNLDLKEDEKNTFWKVAQEQKLIEKIKEYNIVLQGELIGEGVQKNKYKIKGHDFYVFNIYSINEGKFLDYNAFVDWADRLEIKHVPVLSKAFTFSLNQKIEDWVYVAKGVSQINPDVKREGVVVRPKKEIYDRKLGRLSFKVINPEFLIEHGE